MGSLKSEITRVLKNMPAVTQGCNNEIYLDVTENNFDAIIKLLSQNNFELMALFAAEGIKQAGGFTIFYAFEKNGFVEFLVLRRAIAGNKATSIAMAYPSACWYEREVHDGFGIEFGGAFDKRHLFLHEMYPRNFHPLLKSFNNREIKTNNAIGPADEYKFKEVTGEGVYQIPVGPVHAGIIEPGHFRFSVIGETIFNLEVRMFWKHRGIEKLAEGKTPQDTIKIAETISGDETAANAAAFCIAVEKISGIKIPERAQYLRTVLLELERIYSYLGDMAGMIIDVAYPVGASQFFILREEIFRQNEALTGSRFAKGVLGIGGLKKDVSSEALQNLAKYIEGFAKRFGKATRVGDASYFSLADRFETTGIVHKDLISPLHITGPVARASGVYADARADHPYGLYESIKMPKRTFERGDVLSRFELKAAEILDSVRIIQKAISKMPSGDVFREQKIKDGFALSVVEAARGQSVHWVYIKNGVIDRYKIRTPSFCNWQSIEHAVLGNIVPDFPLINKSMNLSYSGTDL